MSPSFTPTAKLPPAKLPRFENSRNVEMTGTPILQGRSQRTALCTIEEEPAGSDRGSARHRRDIDKRRQHGRPDPRGDLTRRSHVPFQISPRPTQHQNRQPFEGRIGEVTDVRPSGRRSGLSEGSLASRARRPCATRSGAHRRGACAGSHGLRWPPSYPTGTWLPAGSEDADP